jgi:hypothetical protein
VAAQLVAPTLVSALMAAALRRELATRAKRGQPAAGGAPAATEPTVTNSL